MLVGSIGVKDRSLQGSNRKILVVGDAIVDRWITGRFCKTTHEWPTPRPVITAESQWITPGGAANVAMVLSNFPDLDVTFLFVCDQSDTSHDLHTKLDLAGVSVVSLQNLDYSLPEKVRVVAPDCPEQFRYDWDRGWQDIYDWQIVNYLQEHQFDAVIVSDYGKGVCTPAVCQAAIKADRISVIDPKGSDWCKYRGATIIKCNGAELQEVCVGGLHSPKICKDLSTNLIITNGSHDVVLWLNPGTRNESFPVPKTDIVSATGAGDVFVSTLAAEFVATRSLNLSIEQAIKASSLFVGLPIPERDKIGEWTSRNCLTELRSAT